jgi:hypothetical protein
MSGMADCQPSAQSQPTAYDNGFWYEGGANLQLSVQAGYANTAILCILADPMVLLDAR